MAGAPAAAMEELALEELERELDELELEELAAAVAGGGGAALEELAAPVARLNSSIVMSSGGTFGCGPPMPGKAGGCIPRSLSLELPRIPEPAKEMRRRRLFLANHLSAFLSRLASLLAASSAGGGAAAGAGGGGTGEASQLSSSEGSVSGVSGQESEQSDACNSKVMGKELMSTYCIETMDDTKLP
jgi:hypothetical protein